MLSAYGIGIAERRSIAGAGIHAELATGSLNQAISESNRLLAALSAEFAEIARVERRAFLHTAGSDTLLDVPYTEDSNSTELAAEFSARHRRRFGFDALGETLVLQSIEVEVIAADPRPVLQFAVDPAEDGGGVTQRRIWFAGAWVMAPVWRRSTLRPGAAIDGPAMLVEDNATVIVEPDWRATIDTNGMLVLQRVQSAARREQTDTAVDPVMLEIFNNQFMHIAEQMGVVLEQTAHSVNIKERLDYSCALFDRGGELVANAPHVPVHLGSMGDSVREVIRTAKSFQPGDAYMLNAPYRGGTHLPDITVVSPVFNGDGEAPDFFVASRAHHADVGGTTPGSMPANSRTIAEEGIVIEPTKILEQGALLEAAILDCLTQGDAPARNPARNLADLQAQLAANATGHSELARLLERYGPRVVHAYMQHVRDNAEACTRQALRALTGGRFVAPMDGGEQIAVAVTIDRERGEARIDFSGTSAISAGNLNAPRSVVNAVVLYVLRTLVKENIPLNAGCLAPIDLIVPQASLLDPVYPAAIAGGNVETSQCIADALLAALGAAAASQGTMNNLTFGDAEHQYYETICGGCGAGPGFNGASAVHSHMTNSRLTDIEVLEQRFPVRVRRFAMRRGSGGSGRWHGGDGVIREIEFLQPLRLSLLASRRHVAPFGLNGGGAGAPGRDTVIRGDGSREPLSQAAEVPMHPGDRILIETPG
ncbi:MAG: hydantoinase B/oxoprolinase family protein, partial [Gammaproteobacteria bacterium]|nr:hydantoinase B/oxoprolinase family protein [Gammaproteobacteria bacterium]